jgi:hypothetical protein
MFPPLMPNFIARRGVGTYSEEIVKEVIMVAESLAGLDTPALAQLLFAGPVQPSDHLTPAEIRMALAAQFRRCQGDLAAALGTVAQEAGDHPESYAARMRWAIRSVARAFAGRPASNAVIGRAA